MKKNKLFLLACLAGLAMAIFTNVQLTSTAAAETEICPGRGEKCAQVSVLFIKYWKYKEPGGPGIIVVE